MRPVPLALGCAATLLFTACGGDEPAADLAVPADLSAQLDLKAPCVHVATWPSNGSAFFTPLGHDGKDVATVRSNRERPGSDGGSQIDQLNIEVRTTPGTNVAYPRSVQLDATSDYAHCAECVVLKQDLVNGTASARFFARRGTLFLSRVDQAKTGRIELMAGGLELVEWSDADVAVPDGACYQIDTASFSLAYSAGPVTTNDM